MTPTALVDPEGQLLFVHDCVALCGDGKTRTFPARSYVLGVPPWAIEQRDRLTVLPSIDCGACSVHGFIRDGEWVSAG